jgi:hypothetical protein
MAKTAAQRQAAYRARRAQAGSDGNGERRLSVWVSTEAALALGRLAGRYGITKREMLERLVLAEDKRILDEISLDSAEWTAYFCAGSVTA